MTMHATTDGTENNGPLRRPALAALVLACTLTRDAGSPIACETIDVGTTGMRLSTHRPLAVDETVSFDLPLGEARVRGQARVVGQERPDVYVAALRPPHAADDAVPARPRRAARLPELTPDRRDGARAEARAPPRPLRPSGACYALATFALNCLTSSWRTAWTVPSPIDAALPLTFAVPSTVPPSPPIWIVTVPSALLWPPDSFAWALTTARLEPASVSTISTGPLNGHRHRAHVHVDLGLGLGVALGLEDLRARERSRTSLFTSEIVLQA